MLRALLALLRAFILAWQVGTLSLAIINYSLMLRSEEHKSSAGQKGLSQCSVFSS